MVRYGIVPPELDISADMLAVAHDAAAREGLAIEWQKGQAEALPFPD
jgi:ubiquinone/menaquinone biosynthesis C-methylase UbiE